MHGSTSGALLLKVSTETLSTWDEALTSSKIATGSIADLNVIAVRPQREAAKRLPNIQCIAAGLIVQTASFANLLYIGEILLHPSNVIKAVIYAPELIIEF